MRWCNRGRRPQHRQSSRDRQRGNTRTRGSRLHRRNSSRWRQSGSRCRLRGGRGRLEIQLTRHDRRDAQSSRGRLHRGGPFCSGSREYLRVDRFGSRRNLLRGGHRGRRHHRRGATINVVVHRCDVRDAGHVGRGGDIVRIDITHVTVAGLVRRDISLTRPQRDPADRTLGIAVPRVALAAANRDSDAQKGDQRRRVNGSFATLLLGAFRRYPAPARAFPHPAAIVERRKAPGRVVDPGPAPGSNITPMAIAIRHPRRCHRRVPNPSILRARRPGADSVQSITTCHSRHDRWGRRLRLRRARYPLLFGQPCRYEGIEHCGDDAGGEIAGAVDPPGLPSGEGQGGIGAVDAGRTLQHGHGGGMAGVARDDFIRASLGDHRDTARCGNAVNVAGRDIAQPQENSALFLGRLEIVIVEGVDVEFGRLVQRQMRRVDVDRGRGTRLSPKRVAGRDGVVQHRDAPVGLIGGMKRDRAQQQSGATDPGRGIGGGRCLGMHHGTAGKSGAKCQDNSHGER